MTDNNICAAWVIVIVEPISSISQVNHAEMQMIQLKYLEGQIQRLQNTSIWESTLKREK